MLQCGDTGMFITPAGRRIPAKPGSQLLVTPKFDPRLPLPPNTQLRRPLPREVPMSLTGSPLSVSPDKPKLKAIMGEFLETLERDVPSLDQKDIRQFHSVLQRHLDLKP
ncbi:Cell division protein borealin [Trinorchestia longiramus]|nr:Cell division protein borealin [Trinorchestia longiramus]